MSLPPRKFTCVAAYFFVRQDSRTSVALCTACPPNRMSISLRFSPFQLIVHAELCLAYLYQHYSINKPFNSLVSSNQGGYYGHKDKEANPTQGACLSPPEILRRQVLETTGAREHVRGPDVIPTATAKGAREGARVGIISVGCPRTAGRATKSGQAPNPVEVN